ncbi:hypothetical protein B0H11DRAFT_1921219 [Mycena galericulata]|nr:hypothetical protein B0H11DRAFT_1921219 [Mycena galericulata]
MTPAAASVRAARWWVAAGVFLSRSALRLQALIPFRSPRVPALRPPSISKHCRRVEHPIRQTPPVTAAVGGLLSRQRFPTWRLSDWAIKRDLISVALSYRVYGLCASTTSFRASTEDPSTLSINSRLG